ncbi:syntaxin 131 family protein [Hibiscus syriacus]|uniref:Syntaxin 131 family protein n=1 Tax=Hibiscus syriacus TaxID=106335 RepID=A0A6A2X3C2_HIBSY|nr:syntaxin 131 family protein [Hibiscus syriacus]
MERPRIVPIFFMGILVWCCLAASANASTDYMKYKDPKQPLNVRIKDLIGRMALEEKIGQMVQIERNVTTAEVMRKYCIGSLLSGGGSVPAPQASPKDWINMINEDSELVKRIGAATALEVRATGIQYALHLVSRDPRWGRCYKSYSEDLAVVQAMTEIIPGLQGDISPNSPKGVPFVAGKNNVAACAKHYVGDGGTTKGINENNTVIDMHGLLSIHMPGYYTSIIKGVSTVMVSYSTLNGAKMHANHDMVTNFLKKTLRFRIPISLSSPLDSSPPHANYTYSIQAAITAGLDMIIVPYNYTEFIDGLTYLVKNSFIPMSRIDDAVKRILRVKFMMGLFENPLADESLVEYLGSQEHRESAREAASKILVAGSHADNLGYQCGGWTIEWQKPTQCPFHGQGLQSSLPSRTQLIQDSIHMETQGDSLNLTIPHPGPSTITNLCGTVKCVVVVVSGRPVVIQPYLASIDALVAAWLPGSEGEGQGVADVLFGDYGFTGKLSFTWFC